MMLSILSADHNTLRQFDFSDVVTNIDGQKVRNFFCTGILCLKLLQKITGFIFCSFREAKYLSSSSI